MTTKQVFEKIISKRAWYNALGISYNEGSSIKNRYKKGNLSNDKMEEVILKAGYKVEQEKTWIKI